MIRSYTHAHKRLFAGYRTLVRGAFKLLAATFFLLLVSAGISLPVWFFAHATPLAFDITVMAAIGVAIIWSILRRIRAGGGQFSFRHLMISATMIAVPTFILIAALALHSTGFVLIGALLLSGIVAWRVVPS